MATFNVGPYTYVSGPQQFAGLATAMEDAQPVDPLARTTDPVQRRNIIAGQARNELQERLGQALMQREIMGDDPGATAMIDPTKLSKQDAQNLFMTATYTGPEFRLDPGADFQSDFDALYNDPAKLARALMQTQPVTSSNPADDPVETPGAFYDLNNMSIGEMLSQMANSYRSSGLPFGVLGLVNMGERLGDAFSSRTRGTATDGITDPGSYGDYGGDPDGVPDSF